MFQDLLNVCGSNCPEECESVACAGSTASDGVREPGTSAALCPTFIAPSGDGPPPPRRERAASVSLPVSAAALTAWLDFICAAPAGAAPIPGGAAHAARCDSVQPLRQPRLLTPATLQAVLAVADVVNDMHTVDAAARMLGAALFLSPAPPPAAAVEVFSQLPTEVATAAMRTSGAPLGTICARLPHCMHPLAVHASFPSIAASRCADLSSTPLATALGPSTVPTLSGITCLAVVNHPDLRGRGAGRACALLGLADALLHLHHIKSLDISQNSLEDWGVSQLAPGLQHMSGTLESLQLGGNLLCSPAAAGLDWALASATRLEALDLHSNLLECSGFQEIAPNLIALPAVKSVNLSCNKLSSYGATALGALVATWSCVEDLDVSGNGVAASGAAALLEGLARRCLGTVTGLDLSFNCIGKRDWAGADIAALVSRFRGLQTLDVGFNQVHTAGCASLSGALGRLVHLRRLGLYRAGIGEGAARLLLAGLAKLSCLEVLDLRHNRVKAAATALVAALPSPGRLKRLRLCGNRMGDDATADLVAALRPAHSGLEMLELARNRVGARTCSALAAALPALPHVHEVRLEDNGLVPERCGALQGFGCIVWHASGSPGAVGAAADAAAVAAGGDRKSWDSLHSNALWGDPVWDDLQTFSSGESRTTHVRCASVVKVQTPGVAGGHL